MVQIKVTASVLLAAAAIVPAVAYGFDAEDSLVTREDNEFTSSYARGFDDLDLEEREFNDELYEREPLGGGMVRSMFRFGRKHAGSAISSATPPQSPNETREFNDDLLEREVEEELYGRGGGPGQQGRYRSGRRMRQQSESPTEREFDEELVARGGGGGGHGGYRSGGRGGFGGPRRMRQQSSETPSEREFDEELVTRGGGGQGGYRSGRRGGSEGRGGRHDGSERPRRMRKQSSETPTEREFDEELVARGGGGQGGYRSGRRGGSEGRGGRHDGSEGPRRMRKQSETPTEREFDEELLGRDVDSDLFEREPEPFLFMNHIKKWWKNKTAKKDAAPPADDAAAFPDTRSFDEMELLEREYFDELD